MNPNPSFNVLVQSAKSCCDTDRENPLSFMDHAPNWMGIMIQIDDIHSLFVDGLSSHILNSRTACASGKTSARSTKLDMLDHPLLLVQREDVPLCLYYCPWKAWQEGRVHLIYPDFEC